MNVLPNSLELKSSFSRLSSFILFVALSLVLFFLLPSGAFSQAPACYTFQGEQSLCIPPGQPGNLCQIGDQYYCPGHSTMPTTSSHPSHDCWNCGSGPTQEKVTCSERDDLSTIPDGSGGLKTCGELGYSFPYENGPTCGDANGVVQCVSVYSDGCRSCAVPQCPIGTQPAYNKCVAPITCSTTASATGTTTGQASTAIGSNQDPVGYTTAEWRLTNQNDGSSQIVGYTTIDSNGNSSNSFTSLQPSTGYRVEVTYRDPDGPRTDVSCSPANFTTWTPGQQPTQTTCSLTASPQSLNTGGSSTWTLTSTGEPEGARGYWHGPGDVEGRITAPDYIDTVLYNTSGSDSRWVEVKNSSGTTLCTTDTVQVYVNPNNCSALSIAPSSLNLAVGGTGQLTAFGVNGSISSWTSDNTSIVSVTSFGNPTTVTGRGAGTTVIS